LKVYLSYARSDTKFAKQIAQHMIAAGMDVFPHGDWPQDPNAALAHAEAIVILFSRQALASPFVLKELEFGLLAPRFEHRFIPVMLDASTKVPWIVRRLKPIRSSRDPGPTAEKILRRLRAVRPTRK